MMSRTFILVAVFAALAGCVTAPPPTPKAAAIAPVVEWIHPLLEGYGAVHPDAQLPMRPEADLDYKILVDVVHTNPNHSQLSDSLDRLARLMNLMAYAGVPTEHVHIVALLDGGAGLLALTNASYQNRFKVDNPNLALLHLLKSHGVLVMVCSQAMAEAHLSKADFTADSTVTLSALTDLAVFGQRGYSYMQL